MELRSPDPCVNPYLAFSLLLGAGLEGIATRAVLPAPCNCNLFTAPASVTAQYEELPSSLHQAVAAANASTFIRTILPQRTVDSYLTAKASEWEECSALDDKNSVSFYFERY